MSQLQVTGEAKIRDIQGPVVANDGVITALDGAANQYVRGDGTLASFPTSGGGGSSVSYYLNGSVNQGTFGGSTYYQMSKNAITGVGTNFSASANGLIAQFITDANDPDVVSIPSGNWNVEFFMNVSASSGALASFYVEIYKYDGSTFTLLATNVATPEFLTNTTTVDAYFTSVAMPLSAMAITDRLAIRIFVNVASKTVTLYTENNRLCQVITTFSNGLTSLNNLTDQSQYLTTGTSGTNFAIVSSGDTHTFNLPVASATNTGKLSSTDWSTFNNKQPAGNYVTLDTAQTITGDKTFTGIVKNDNGILLKNSFITYSNGYTSLSADIGNLVISSLISGTPYDNLFIFTPSTSNTYTFPNATGTLALTSNLSAYVPYTGATANVDLGTYDLSAKYLNANGSAGLGGVLNIKQDATYLAKGNGYSSIASTSVLFDFFGYTGASTYKNFSLRFDSLTNNTQRTFTLPDLSGTLALLEGSQTFSGTKFFSSALYAERGIVLAAGVTTFLAGSTSLNGNANGLTIGLGVTVGGTTTTYAHQLLFPQITPRTYTFPAASGTIALTSDLSAYLPLTGGTLTGALSGTSATFSGDLTIDTNTLFVDSTNNRVGILTSSPQAALDLRGQMSIGFNAARTAGTALVLTGATDNTTNVSISTNTFGSGVSLILGTGGAPNTLTLANNGAATFSSSVTADVSFMGQVPTYGAANAQFSHKDRAGAGEYSFLSANDGVTYINAKTGTDINFRINNSNIAMFKANGNLLINTTTDLVAGNRRLQVQGTCAISAKSTGTGGEPVLEAWQSATAGDNVFCTFITESSYTLRGSIDYNRPANVTRYNTTSDGNLKNIIGYADKQKSIDILNSTKIREYSWKDDENNKLQIGVIAQELYETYKGAVSKGSDDELFGTEDYKTWGVDKTAFTFHLIAGWQKHEQIINDLQAQIEELKELIKNK